MNVVYFRTTAMPGDSLQQAIASAKDQNAAVLSIYDCGLSLSPSQVWEIGKSAGRKWLLTSVRRSISVLEDAGSLLKTSAHRNGPHGRPETLWRKASAP